MIKPITKLQRTCDPCREARHDVCAAWLGKQFGDHHRPCPCSCRDENGKLTYQALVEMARRHPEVTARRTLYRDAFDQGSWDLHHRMKRGRR